MLNFKTHRSKREYDAYEKGLQRDLWKHFKLAGSLEKKNRNRIIKTINDHGFPAFSGSCSEIYLEKCFKKWRKICHGEIYFWRNL